MLDTELKTYGLETNDIVRIVCYNILVYYYNLRIYIGVTCLNVSDDFVHPQYVLYIALYTGALFLELVTVSFCYLEVALQSDLQL